MTCIHIAAQLGLYSSGMHSRSADATLPMPTIKSNGKQNVRGLRPAISNKRFRGCPVEIWVAEIDVRETVTSGREIDQPSSSANERRYPVDEDKVPEVIGAELRFKTVRSVTKRCGHHTCIGDDHIEGITFFQQPFGTGAHAREA